MSLPETMASGFIAGGMAAIFTHPVDVIKTNLMVNKDIYFRSYFKCVKFLYNEDGIKAFARGLGLRYVHVSVLYMIFFAGYEQFLNFCICKHAELSQR